MAFPDDDAQQIELDPNQAPGQVNQVRAGGVDQRGQTVDTQVNTLGDVIFRVQQYIKHPPTFYSDLRHFLQRYWIDVALTLALQLCILYLYVRLEGPYLLPLSTYTMAALSLAIASVCAAIALRRLRAPISRRSLTNLALIICLAAFLSFVATIGVQAYNSLHPFQFEESEFGIAVATFGYGMNGRTSSQSYEISEMIEKKLRERITDASAIRVIRTGVVQEHSTAEQNPHGAKLVIRGTLLLRGEDIEANFTILQAKELVDSPQIPQAIPVLERKLTFPIRLTATHCTDPEAAIERQSIGIAAFSLGLAHYYNARPEMAVPEFDEARKMMGEDDGGCIVDVSITSENLSLLNYFSGKSYQLLGDYVKAQELFEEAAKKMADDPALIHAMIYNYRVFGQEEERQEAYRHLLRVSENPPPERQLQAAYDRALAHDALQNYDAALDDFEAIIAKDATFFVAYLGAGAILSRLKRFDEALDYYERAEVLVADKPLSHMWLLLYKGILYETRNQEGDLERARDMYIQAIEIDTDKEAVDSDRANNFVTLRYYLANVYRKLGDTELALKELHRLTELAAVRNWSFSVLGDYQFELQDYEAAIKSYETAVHAPAYSKKITYAHLGQAYSKVDAQTVPDKEAKAVAAFEDALQEPGGGDEFVHFEYGVALFSFGRHADAIEQLEIALALEEGQPSDPPRFSVKTRRNLGQMYLTVGNLEGAIAMFSSLVEHCDLVEASILEFALEQLNKLGETDVACRVDAEG
jgi:tetratricopeptide (TPR) repeat protein